jgi:hypothetical protein
MIYYDILWYIMVYYDIFWYMLIHYVVVTYYNCHFLLGFFATRGIWTFCVWKQSLTCLVGSEAWRMPIVSGQLKQFFCKVNGGPLNSLLRCFPLGTRQAPSYYFVLKSIWGPYNTMGRESFLLSSCCNPILPGFICMTRIRCFALN